MRENLMELIYNGEITADDLSDAEQDLLLQEYTDLALTCVNSSKENLQALGMEILSMVKEAGLTVDYTKETLH